MGQLAVKIAVVTGGGGGISRATAKRFVAAGAQFFITKRRAAGLAKAAQKTGAKATAVQGDGGQTPI